MEGPVKICVKEAYSLLALSVKGDISYQWKKEKKKTGVRGTRAIRKTLPPSSAIGIRLFQ